MAFSWKDKEKELKTKIEEVVKKFNDFINSDIGKFLC